MAMRSKHGRVSLQRRNGHNTVSESTIISDSSQHITDGVDLSRFSYDSRRKEVIACHPLYKYFFKELRWIGMVAAFNLALLAVLWFILV